MPGTSRGRSEAIRLVNRSPSAGQDERGSSATDCLGPACPGRRDPLAEARKPIELMAIAHIARLSELAIETALAPGVMSG